MYAVDACNYRQVPIGVVIPRSKEDVVQTVAACRKFGAPLLSRAGGTSIPGQTCNTAIVMDWSKYMHGVLELNARSAGRVCCRGPSATSCATKRWRRATTFSPGGLIPLPTPTAASAE